MINKDAPCLYIVPIEPLEERYSADWLKWTFDWSRNIYDTALFFALPQEHYGKIETGQFLDSIQTNVFKNKQLELLLQKFAEGAVKDRDIFWFHDLWFPGIEALAYIRDTTGIKFKIWGMLHAGTYDPNDFLSQCNMGYWAKYFEKALIRMVDGIFVATKYHRELLCRARSSNPEIDNKVHVVPFPIFQPAQALREDLLPWWERENAIVFPHRLAPEKGYEDLEKFSRMLAEHGSWKTIITKLQAKTKDEYYDLLCKSKYAISFALQETWGIAMQEAVMCGCVPIVPDRLSYREMYPKMFRYRGNYWDAVSKIRELEKASQTQINGNLSRTYQKIIDHGAVAFDNMYRIMRAS